MTQVERDFPVVGVGASAGGLEAYRQFLSALPDDTGAAFVFIQHLDPHHESMMADLLSKYATIPVVQADHDMPLEPDRVYIIPPNKFLKLVDHGLFLEDPVKERGIRLSIDHFFRSLAEAKGEKSIGVLLSGTGSDGSIGLREIKAAGGLVLVQEPATAEYDGMPRSAINTGVVDFVLPISDMPEAMVKFIRHPYLDGATDKKSSFSSDAPDHFKTILALLRAHTEYDFRSYKTGTLERRIQRRMGLNQIAKLEDYIAFLRDTPGEMTALFKDLLIGVTRFFRDEQAWEALETTVITRMIQQKAAGDPLRVWVPGCASGEEAYTVAMVLFNQQDIQRKMLDFQVFATDLNDDAIATARAGIYPSAIAGDVPQRYLKKFFTQDGDNLRVNKRLRETVIFATQNVISDPPFSKLDLISCRNLMIYLEADIQRRMIEMFHFALAPDGVLFLGPSESGDRPGRLFESLSKSHRIYRKTATARARHGSFPIIPSRERQSAKSEGHAEDRAHLSSADVARRALLDRFVPASVLVNRRFEVQYFHGQVRDYLDYPSGEPSSDLTEIVLDGLKSKLRGVLARTLDKKERNEAIARNVKRDGNELNIRITAEPLKNPSGNLLILVSFEDASEPRDREKAAAARAAAKAESKEDETLIQQLEYELQATKEDLQSTIEEMETANEELKASNEEVMSMNEELQSTNEELETSREELQSLNEELSTVNSQLEEKVTEIEASNNDLVNLLSSTNIATIFLDTELCIRRFTPATRELMRIIDSDVGRPIEDLSSRVNDSTLQEDARRVLDKLQPLDADVENSDGHHFIRRIQPYRTTENKIEGVVVTYTDVTRLKEATEKIRKRESQTEAVAQLGQVALSGAPMSDLFAETVEKLARLLGVRMAKILELDEDGKHLRLVAGVGWKDGLVGQALVDSGVASQAGYTLQQAAPVIVNDFAKEKRFTAPQLLKDHDVLCGASVIIGPASEPWGVLGAHDCEAGACEFDLDDVNFMHGVSNSLWLAIADRRAHEAVERERAELRGFIDAMPFQLSVVSPEQRYLMVNRAYEDWGMKPEEVEGRLISDVLDKDSYRNAKPKIEGVLKGEPQRYELDISPANAVPGTRLVTYVPRQDLHGRLNGFYSAAVDITPQKIVERKLAERTAQYEMIGESIPYGVWICDADGHLRYVSQSFLDMVGMTEEDALKFGWADRLAPGTAEGTLSAWRDCVESGDDWEREHRFVDRDGDIVTVLALGRAVRDGNGKILSWVGLNLDITERKKDEERSKVISAELDHRVKNVLATISSIARLSGRSANSLTEFRSNFEARIAALSRAHQTLAQSKWEGMPIRTLVDNEIKPYAEKLGDSIHFAGPNLVLTPSAAQSMALVLHELATNAAKYGPLKDGKGSLSISWNQIDGNDGTALQLAWIESGLEGITPPKTTGFGTIVITDVIEAQCDAEVDLEFLPEGLAYRVVLPAECFKGNQFVI